MSATTATRRELRRARTRRPLAVPLIVAALFLGGALTVLYPSAASWVTQYQQSRIIADLSDEVDEIPPERLEQSIIEAHEYNEGLSGEAVLGANANVPSSEPDATAALTYDDQLAANDGGLMARLKLSAIDLDLPIYHGTSDQVLLEGVGHLEGTSLPVGGKSTHSVLTGHRGLADAELFTRLNEVEVGDTFTIEVFGQVLTYRVKDTIVVEPEETETLRPVRGEDLVTLVTCTPLGINSQRILVTGERVSPTPIEDLDSAGLVPDVPGFPWWAVAIGAVALGVGGYVWVAVRPRRRRATTADRRARKAHRDTQPEASASAVQLGTQ